MIEKLKLRKIIPIVHFICSFFYERLILIFKLDMDMIATIPRNQIISDQGERIIGYLFAKLFALVFIFFLWSFLFFLWDHRRELEIKVFTALMVIGLVTITFMWPDVFIGSIDNYITYSYALRFWPEYWHSAYTSFMYTACMMVCPHPVSITLLQWIFGCFTFGYLYYRISNSPSLKHTSKYFVALVLFMPQIFTLLTNGYRTEPYALLCVCIVNKTIMDLLEEKKASVREFIAILCVLGLISVWRTEGIILGVLLSVIWIVFIQKEHLKKGILYFAIMIGFFVCFFVPQKLGDMKYYGKDYSFINSFPTLQNILNCETADLAYDGVEQDLAAIEQVVPVEIVKQYGMDGYRRYNYQNGRGDINQSLASEEAGRAYMQAYYNLVLHNPVIYARTQGAMLLNIWMLRPYIYVEAYKGDVVLDLPPWKLMAWEIGESDLMKTGHTETWRNIEIRRKISVLLHNMIGLAQLLLQKLYVYSFVLLIIPVLQIYMVFHELYMWIKKKKGKPGFGAISFVLLGQAFAISLVMPANVLVYFHAYYYCSFVVVLVYLLSSPFVQKRIR